MRINIIKSYRNIIAISDKELLGKKFSEENKELYIKESFYQGKIHNKKEVEEIIIQWAKEDATFNIVGERSIKLALKTKLIDKKSIGYIDNIPYALVLL